MAQFVVETMWGIRYFDTRQEFEQWEKGAKEQGWKKDENYAVFERV